MMWRTAHLIVEAVRLDWRLAVAECRVNGQDLALVAVIGVIILGAASESALSMAAALAGTPPEFVAAMLIASLWSACGAAVVLALATGVHRTTERIVSHLRLHPVNRGQSFLVVQAMGLAGRYVGAAGIASLPFLLLAATALDGRRFVAIAAASLLVLRLVPGLLRVFFVAARVLRPTGLAIVCLGGVGLIVVLVSTTWGGRLVSVLPPSVVGRLAVPGAAADVWLALLGWTAAVGVLEWLAMASDRVAAPAPGGGLRVAPIAAPMRVTARLLGLEPALLHGELVRLVRWRRFPWAYATAIGIGLMPTLTLDAPGIVPRIVGPVMLLVMMGAQLGNLFGPDRAGVQAYWLVLEQPAHAIRAKIAAVGIFIVAAFVAVLAAGLIASSRPPDAGALYLCVAAVGFLAWSAACGSIASVLFPAPVDPQALGTGSIVRGAGRVMVVLSNGVFAGVVVGVAWLYDTRRIGIALLFTLGITIALFAIALARLTAEATRRLLLARREHLLNTLGISTTLS